MADTAKKDQVCRAMPFPKFNRTLILPVRRQNSRLDEENSLDQVVSSPIIHTKHVGCMNGTITRFLNNEQLVQHKSPLSVLSSGN